MAKVTTKKSINQTEIESDFGNIYGSEISSKINQYSKEYSYPEYKANTYTTPPKKSSLVKKAPVKKTVLDQNLVNDQKFSIARSDLFTLKLAQLNEPLTQSEQYNCAVGFRMGKTTSGTFFKQIVCGKEFCKTCGSDYSISHIRRIVRVLPKVMQMSEAGYMVITVPKELREKFKSKKNLNDFRNFIKRKLKRGYSYRITHKGKNFYTQKGQVKRAFMRWHWCGEDGLTFKPHLNILIDKSYIDSFYLSKLKIDLSNWFKNQFEMDYNPVANIYYAYSSNKSQNGQRKVKHWINYITRSTAKNLTDIQSLETIHGYRNISYIGKFEKVKFESTSRAASIINNGIDLETGEKIFWGAFLKPKSFFTYYKHQAVDLGAGIYFVLDS
jgi:hypothetical protein